MRKSVKLYGIIFVAVIIAALVAWAGSHRGETLAGIPIFAIAVAAAVLIQWIAFVPALMAGTEKYYDLMGGVTFISVTTFVLIATPDISVRGWIAGAMVILWSARLASFLFKRVLAAGDDSRFDDIKRNPARFLLTWTLQGLWVSFTASAAWIAITSDNQPPLGWIGIIGIAVWVVGIGIEITADLQKSSFKKDPANEGKFINEGLWSRSRHPNYFGEILLWTGVLILAAPVFVGWQWIGVISPLFTALLLTKVSGIPMLEKSADKRWGDDADYQEYKATTPVLIPKLTK